MAKIGSFYKDPIYIITQSNHGINQAYCAFDFGYSNYGDKHLYASFDLTFKRKWSSGYNGGAEYWLNGVKNTFVQIVHWTGGTGNFKKGEQMGIVPGDHVHIALNVEGKWQVYLDYADRSAELYFWTYGQKHFKWTNWDTYTDKQLPLIYNSTEMVTLQQPLTIQITGTPLNMREQPNTSSKVVGTINDKVVLGTKIVAAGTDVNGNSTWYLVSYNSVNGYISGAFVKEISQDCGECEAKLAAAQAMIIEEQNKYTKLATDVRAYTQSVEKSNEDYKKLLNIQP